MVTKFVNLKGDKYRKDEADNWKGRFWNYPNISAFDVKCMALQGLATTLIPFLLEDDSQYDS